MALLLARFGETDINYICYGFTTLPITSCGLVLLDPIMTATTNLCLSDTGTGDIVAVLHSGSHSVAPTTLM